MSIAAPTPLSPFLPLEGGGRCVRGLDGDHNSHHTRNRRLSRWTHRVGVNSSHTRRETPPPDTPNELAPPIARQALASQKTALTRGVSSSPIEGEAKGRRYP
jgi:hypothetical protein